MAGPSAIPAISLRQAGCGNARRSLGRARVRAAGGGALVLVAGWLGGCSAAAERTLAWWGWGWLGGLALVLVAGLAYRLGRASTRPHGGIGRRGEKRPASPGAASRGEAPSAIGWHWQTDAADRLRDWAAPGRAPVAQCALFDPSAAGNGALAAALHARQPFSALRLQAAQAVDGSRQWELRGAPQFDARGAFCGFAGSARPLDAEDALNAAAALLMPALRASDAPTVVAWDHGQGWRLAEINPAARARWPVLAPAMAPDRVDEAPGPSLTRALAALPAAGAVEVVDGWRISGTGTLASGGRGAVLVQTAGPGAESTELESLSFTVSHDLRAPVRVVEGFARIVKEDYGARLDRVGNDHLDRVLGAAARMNLMIDALLTMARLSSQPLSRQPVDLSLLAGYVIDELRRTAPQREVEVQIQDGLSTHGDPTLLRLVLENLLGNAWKYSARSDPARITFARMPLAAPAGAGAEAGEEAAALPAGPAAGAAPATADGSDAAAPPDVPPSAAAASSAPVVPAALRRRVGNTGTVYVVRDNGAGFDMRGADRLFGLFQRLHSASDFAGHGVGLASVQRIVRRHGGEIWADAAPGRGAAFFFTLGQ